MVLTTKSQLNISEIKEGLAKKFPNYVVKSPLLNKKAINVIHNSSRILIFKKGEELKVLGSLNIMKTWIFITFVLLLFFTLIGGFIFYGIMLYTKKEEFKALEEEVGTFIKENYFNN